MSRSATIWTCRDVRRASYWVADERIRPCRYYANPLPQLVPAGVATAVQLYAWLDRQIGLHGPNHPYLPTEQDPVESDSPESDDGSGSAEENSDPSDGAGVGEGDQGVDGVGQHSEGAGGSQGDQNGESKGPAADGCSPADSEEGLVGQDGCEPEPPNDSSSDAGSDPAGGSEGKIGEGPQAHASGESDPEDTDGNTGAQISDDPASPTDRTEERTTDGSDADLPSPASECVAGPEMDQEIDDDESGAGWSRTSRPVFGGIYASDVVALREAPKLTQQARQVRAAFRRLIQRYAAGTVERGDRLDGRLLCREMVSRRWHLARASRRDADIPTVLIACDVSASCSAAAQDTVNAAIACSLEIPGVVVAVHSNGELIAVHTDGRSMGFNLDQRLDTLSASLRPVLSVVFGDFDAVDAYAIMSKSGKLIWLDSFAASHGKAYPAAAKTIAEAQQYGVTPFRMWSGVGDATTAADALSRS